MDNKLTNILQKPIRFIDSVKDDYIFDKRNHAIASFAVDDSIATTVGNLQSPTTFRTWVHEKTVVLGIPDSRLPYFDEGVQFLKKQGYDVVIRNSGGLAVTLDNGVLNFSMILHNDNNLSIHHGYELMVEFIRTLFAKYTSDIQAYEIIGSYCPGDYDLSIGGKKFAGISQRRIRNGVAVQIYLDIEGDSEQRATLIKDFYTISKKDHVTKHVYPNVQPQVMGSLSDLLGVSLSVSDVICLIELLLKKYHAQEINRPLTTIEAEIFQKRWEQMYIRNERVIHI